MNHSPSRGTPSSAAARTTRSTPSAPIPPCRSHRARTRAAVRSRAASGSGSTTKSLPVPWPLANGTGCTGPSLRGTDRVEHRTQQIRPRPVQPPDPRVAAEPGPLPPDEPAGGGHGVPGGGVEAALAVQRGDHLPVAERPGGRAPLTQADLQQPADLRHQPGGEHPLDPPLDQPVQVAAVAVDAD